MKLLLLRPGNEPYRFEPEKVESIIALDYPEGILKVSLRSGVDCLGYMIKFE